MDDRNGTLASIAKAVENAQAIHTPPAQPVTPGAKFALACEGMLLRNDGTIVAHDGKTSRS